MEGNPDIPPFDDDESVIGLTEVDPSPVDDTPAEYLEKGYFPDEEPRGGGETEEMKGIRRTNTLGLRLGDRGAAWWRKATLPFPTHILWPEC
jgi:hypothetical protein